VLGGLVLPVVVSATTHTAVRHPRLERLGAAAALAAAFALLSAREGLTLRLAIDLVFAIAAVIVTIVDLREKRIPNVVLVIGATAVLALALIEAVVTGSWGQLTGALLGSAVLFAVYFLLALLAPKGIGMGDVKLAALAGFVLGGAGWANWILGVGAGAVLGAVAAIMVLIVQRRGPSGTLPYAPTMVLGALLGLFY
jgi:leader peptidase (prepilin peptidase)/N-methyltransferase